MKYSKNIISLIAVAVMLFGMCACGKTDNKSEVIRFSNLTNESDISELSKLLKQSSVNTATAEKVIASIRDYNNTIGNSLLFSEGGIDMSSPIPQYDDIKIDEMWLKKYDMFIGYNCRLTAFELMKDFISVKDTSKINTSALFMDEDALSYSKDNYLTDEEFSKFEAIYSAITTNSSTSSDEQYEIQKKFWESIGVEFYCNESISLISVYIHNHFSEDENELIIGHTGVLIKSNGQYIFLEKLSFQLPYQMIWFNSKQEVKDYLMKAYDTDTTGESAKPFILENNKLM